jgi:hypothetical protein
MNVHRSLCTATRVGGFLARHLLAVLVIVGVAFGIWTMTYVVLLFWAGFVGGGPGGPLAYPFGLVFVLLFSTALCCCLFLPASGIAEWLAGRYGLPVFAQIPLSVAALCLLCITGVVVASAAGLFSSVSTALLALGVLVLSQLVPFGLYWWAAESGPVLLSVFRGVTARARALFSVLPNPAATVDATRHFASGVGADPQSR